MPRFDQCHDQVVRALEKQGWRTENHQIRLRLGKRSAFVDLRAARDANGSRQQIMLVEVKCFPDDEDTTQGLYTAIRQYLIYRAMLVELEEEIPLYLSIPETIYRTVFEASARRVVAESRIKPLIVNLEQEVIVQWME